MFLVRLSTLSPQTVFIIAASKSVLDLIWIKCTTFFVLMTRYRKDMELFSLIMIYCIMRPWPWICTIPQTPGCSWKPESRTAAGRLSGQRWGQVWPLPYQSAHAVPASESAVRRAPVEILQKLTNNPNAQFESYPEYHIVHCCSIVQYSNIVT